MSITLNQILALVGKLDDSPGDDTPRERFRRFLKENVNEVGQIRDYIEECLRTFGDQYNCSLQDLVNYLGHFLEFEVALGVITAFRVKLGLMVIGSHPQNFTSLLKSKHWKKTS
jgi:hypothetical protein